MDPNTFPTKGNLMLAKSSLALSRQGFELMDKKRNILIRELMDLISQAADLQSQIDITFREAYTALQYANIQMGIHTISDIAQGVAIDDSITVKTRSIMGTEIPLVGGGKFDHAPKYSFFDTRESLDRARIKFQKVKELTIELATVETSAYRLAASIKKTQKRANALKNITIPMYQTRVHDITNALEEKEREEFTRLKVIKSRKEKAAAQK